MRSTISWAAIAALLLAAVGAATATPASAVTAITVSPVHLELAAPAGDQRSERITVRNDGNRPFEASVEVLPLDRATVERSAVAWLNVSPRRVQLDPGQDETVGVSVAVPDDQPAGGYYATVAFSVGGAAPEGQTSVGISGRIVVAVMLLVGTADELTREPVIERLAPFIEADGQIGVRAVIHNTGNSHAWLAGDVTVRTAERASAGELTFSHKSILPDEHRLLTTMGTLPLAEDEAYTATVTFTGGDGGQIRESIDFSVNAQLDLRDVAICQSRDRGPTVSLTLRNQGGLGLDLIGRLIIRDEQGQPVDAVPLAMGPLWPGDSAPVSLEVPTVLPTGRYTLVVRIAYGPDLVIEREIAFSIGGTDGTDGAEGVPAPSCASAR